MIPRIISSPSVVAAITLLLLSSTINAQHHHNRHIKKQKKQRLTQSTTTSSLCACSPQFYKFQLLLNNNDCSTSTLSRTSSPGISNVNCQIDNEVVGGLMSSGFVRRRRRRDLQEESHSSNNVDEVERSLRAEQVDRYDILTSQVQSLLPTILSTKQARQSDTQSTSQETTTPSYISSILFIEFDTSGLLTLINTNDTYLSNQTLTNSTSITYPSISTTLNTDIPLDDQLDKIPGGAGLFLFGNNDEGDVILRSRLVWEYSGDCEVELDVEGDTLGWIMFVSISYLSVCVHVCLFMCIDIHVRLIPLLLLFYTMRSVSISYDKQEEITSAKHEFCPTSPSASPTTTIASSTSPTTTSPISNAPTTSTPTVKPSTTSPVTDEPTSSSPTSLSPTESPSNKPVTNEPTTSEPSHKPSISEVITNSPSSNSPTVTKIETAEPTKEEAVVDTSSPTFGFTSTEDTPVPKTAPPTVFLPYRTSSPTTHTSSPSVLTPPTAVITNKPTSSNTKSSKSKASKFLKSDKSNDSKSSKAFGHSKSTKKLPDPKAKKIVSSITAIETKAMKHSGGVVGEVGETKSGKVDSGKGKSGKSNTTENNNGKSGKSSSDTTVVNPKAEKHNNSKKSESILKGKSGKKSSSNSQGKSGKSNDDEYNSHHNKVKSSVGGGGFRFFHQD